LACKVKRYDSNYARDSSTEEKNHTDELSMVSILDCNFELHTLMQFVKLTLQNHIPAPESLAQSIESKLEELIDYVAEPLDYHD
jgi:hypothetical protein